MGRGQRQEKSQSSRRNQTIGQAIIKTVSESPILSNLHQSLEASGGQVYVVGGAIRDQLLGREPKDVDLVVSGLEPPKVEVALSRLPGRLDYTGKDFAVFRYKEDGYEVEVALPRLERSTGIGHNDFAIETHSGLTIEDDLGRRDFTFNAMAVSLSDGRLIDLFAGRDDLAAGILRTVSKRSFQEDPLRLVRGLVATARYGLQPDPTTKQDMHDQAAGLSYLPPERVQAELDKLFAAAKPDQAIKLAQEAGLLKEILPELNDCFGYQQNNSHHDLALGDHLVATLEQVSKLSTDRDLRLAALLHDIGKPASAWTDPDSGQSHYYRKQLDDGSTIGQDHALVGGQLARQALGRLRYSSERNQRIGHLIDQHMWAPFETERGARRFLARVGDEHADDLFLLRQADSDGKGQSGDLSRQRQLVDTVRRRGQATGRSQLNISGHDLLNLGLRGAAVGQALDHLTAAVIDDPNLNSKERLLQLAKSLQ